MVYYNEINKYCVKWLENLISAGVIAKGIVDSRPIEQVQMGDLNGFKQCHFFAGIGGWSYALRLAGFGDDQKCWTGSCPCQPFSTAGRQMGTEDKRHLWPEFKRLIDLGNPSIVFGEQVASKLGRDWLSDVRIDLEALGYEVGASDLCASSAGASHIRQRLYWMAYSRSKSMERLIEEWNNLRCIEKEAFKLQRNRSLETRLPIHPDIVPNRPIDGISRPVGIISAFGNAIVPQLAAKFIESSIEAIGDSYYITKIAA